MVELKAKKIYKNVNENASLSLAVKIKQNFGGLLKSYKYKYAAS